ANSRTVLVRATRDTDGDAARVADLERGSSRLAASVHELRRADTLDAVRGLEGEAATHYFGAFDALLSPSAAPQAFRFTRRSRQPPLDPMNALISSLSPLALPAARPAWGAAGRAACVGFRHADRPGKPSLALDVMEELRAYIADRLAFSLINRRQI